MGKRIRVWFIRILALVIVILMILSLGMNIFTGQKSSKEDQTEQTSQTKKKKSKYTYVAADSKFHLDGVDQDLLLPKGMTVKSQTTNEKSNAKIYTFNGVQYDDISASLVISVAESGKGANMDSIPMVGMEEMADGLKNNGEYSNSNYITFRGKSDNYLEQVQTIMDGDTQYKYEIDYNIYDVANKNYYMISLFLLNPINPSKTDRLRLDRMGKEMMSKTSYMAQDVYSEFALPAEKENEFNHLK